MKKIDKGSTVYPIILAGSVGTRLWPLARVLTPKQFISLNGQDSMFRQAINRAHLISDRSTIIVTNKDIHKQIDQGKLDKEVDYLLEPNQKNTAPAGNPC